MLSIFDRSPTLGTVVVDRVRGNLGKDAFAGAEIGQRHQSIPAGAVVVTGSRAAMARRARGAGGELPLMAEATARNRAGAVPGVKGATGHAAVLDRRTYGMLMTGGGAGVQTDAA